MKQKMTVIITYEAKIGMATQKIAVITDNLIKISSFTQICLIFFFKMLFKN